MGVTSCWPQWANTGISLAKYYLPLPLTPDENEYLAHWGRDKRDIILQKMIYSFSWMKVAVIWFKFKWSLFVGFNWQQVIKIGPDNDLTLNKRQAIIWTNDDIFRSHIYASLSLNEVRRYW